MAMLSPSLKRLLNLAVGLTLCLSLSSARSPLKPRAECVVPANNDGTDDTAGILEAFSKCRSHGRIVFQNTTYYINQVMNITNLVETDIEIHGTLLWSDDIDYWLSHSQYTGFQNGSAAWFLGGTNVTVNGFGYGTLDGNGQAWYDFVKGESNYPNRPHGLAIWGANNLSLIDFRMVQSQMWSVAIMHSRDILVDGVYIRSVSSSRQPARNTDGYDTIDCDRVTFRNLYVRNGDDAIAIKGNSTNILVEDSVFDNSLGLAFGSLGQYIGASEVVENITARNIFCNGTLHGAYVKTWSGDVVNYPPNGGGGGTGYLRNATLTNFTLYEVETETFSITQCTTFSGGNPDCDSSLFEISDITIRNWNGDTASSYVARMDCSAASGGCKNITIEDVAITNTVTGSEVSGYRCSDVSGVSGFEC